MKQNKLLIFIVLLLLVLPTSFVNAQNDSVKYNFGTSVLLSTGRYSPFWLHSNRFGSVTERGAGFHTEAGFEKPMANLSADFDYGFGAQAIFLNDNQKTLLIPQEYYIKARWHKIGMRIGAMKEHYGNQDSVLSAGGFMFSKNSRPMPKIWVGIDKFSAVPFTAGYVEVRGGLSHGWFNDEVYTVDPFLHHKYAYFRFGGHLPLRFQYGLDHVAQWGGRSPNYGPQPSKISDLVRVFVAASGGADAATPDQINVLGNHIISQSMKLDAVVQDFRISAYWQNFTEDTPFRLMWQTMNVSDGIWGLSVRNESFPVVKGFLYEYINTTDQSGPYHDKDGIVYGGSDSYMTNGVYSGGWNYFGANIGTPLISSPYYNTDGYTQTWNNRVKAHHFGIEGESHGISFRVLATFTSNFGVYGYPNAVSKFQNSFMTEFSGKITSDTQWLLSLGVDRGELRGNSSGFLVGLRKSGLLLKY